MNIITISESNYQAYTSLDIVAFSFAYEGAMGEGGGIYIVDKTGQIYHANYFWGEDLIEREHIKDIIPIFEEFEFRLFGCETQNENWVSVDLGFGNSLLMIKDISADFKKKVEEANYQHPGELFQNWPGFVLDLIRMDNSKLTMSDLWDLLDNGD